MKNVILFGFGRQGKKAYNQFKQEFNIIAILDNDIDKHGTNIDDLRIQSFEDVLIRYDLRKYKIIVTVQESNYVNIRKQLIDSGLIEYKDFVSCQWFYSEWYLRFKNQVRIMKVDIPITWRCTLKCRDCMVSLPYAEKNNDIPVEEINESLLHFFNKIDFVMDMDISGGEPFLHGRLAEIIELIGEKYREKIGYLGIITNGMIIPDEKIIALLKKYNIGVSISDYSGNVNYESRMLELCNALEFNKVFYIRNKVIEWFDFAIKKGKYHFNPEAAFRHMRLCKSVCHILERKRVYYCSVDYGAQKSGLISEDNASFIDLDREDNDRRSILDFLVGEKETVPKACTMCGGFGVDNKMRVETAVQL